MSSYASHEASLPLTLRRVKAHHAAINSLNAVRRWHAQAQSLPRIEYRIHPEHGFLQIGQDGSVESLLSGTILTPRRAPSNTAIVRTLVNGVQRSFTVARLVVEAFHGALPSKKTDFKIEHIDGDIFNCAVDNLRLVVFE